MATPKGGNGDVMNIGGSTISVREGCHPVAETTSWGRVPRRVISAVRTRPRPTVRHRAEPRPVGFAPLPRRAGRRCVGSGSVGGRSRHGNRVAGGAAVDRADPSRADHDASVDRDAGRATGPKGVARLISAVDRCRRRRGGARQGPAHPFGPARSARRRPPGRRSAVACARPGRVRAADVGGP